MKIWSIRGTPLTIQTTTFVTDESGLNLLIEQNAIMSPSGNASTKVSANNKHVSLNPSSKYSVTSPNVIIYKFPFVIVFV